MIWSTKKKRSTNGFPLFSLTILLLEKISGIVRHHWKEIEKSETLAKLFPEPHVVATGKSVFFIRSLLCPFILWLNGWALSPTYCDPQT
jgi:hypothetical protein